MDRINFEYEINESIQVGDVLYYWNGTEFQLAGEGGTVSNSIIRNIEKTYDPETGELTEVGVDIDELRTITLGITNVVFCFQKSQRNNSSLKGYTLEARLVSILDLSSVTNDDIIALNKNKKIMYVGSDVTESSK